MKKFKVYVLESTEVIYSILAETEEQAGHNFKKGSVISRKVTDEDVYCIKQLDPKDKHRKDPDINLLKVGEKIKQRRESFYLSRKDLETLAKISYGQVSRIESGLLNIQFDTFVAICKALKCLPNDLIDGDLYDV